MFLEFFPVNRKAEAEILLPVSKSESNRALLLAAWSQGKIIPGRISDSADTLILEKLLRQEEKTVFDAEDAGTTFRFLTSYLSVSGKHCLLTGSQRMKERPIGDLVQALRELGSQIEYPEKAGFPPIELKGFAYSGKYRICMENISSSQFISSLMMAGPALPDGIEIELPKNTGSFPYIELTASMMKSAGIKLEIGAKAVKIPAQVWPEAILNCEADWSSASYFYAILACLPAGSAFDLPGLHPESAQGDRVIADLFRFWHIETKSTSDGIRITKTSEFRAGKKFHYSFENCPDLALTFICLCASSQTVAEFHGLKSLRIKESDRLEAIRQELSKTGIILEVPDEGDSAYLKGPFPEWPVNPPEFSCHKDHRIAMSLAILLAGKNRRAFFDDEVVVKKSFPRFWEEIQKAGFSIRI